MSQADTQDKPSNTLVWCEIPVTDMARAKAFYAQVLEADLIDNNDGPNPMAFLPRQNDSSVSGHLYPGKPSAAGTGSTVHLAAPGTIEAITERVRAAGGKVVSGAIAIPAGRFFYALDLDGNSVGFFEG